MADSDMVVVRFKVKCHPEKTDQAMVLFQNIVNASRALKGVLNFDMGWDITDSNSFIATEVKKVMGLFDQLLSEPPEENVFYVSTSKH